ncbi:MAG TPA: YeeE/YedE thiosulfate transporter family protein, partial [Burkholderiaceae bacterium]|nr:YeeE/YedE thiosulfate transporter family protein [Burkholderiaceae bacterium]
VTRKGRSTSVVLSGVLVGAVAALAWFVSGKLGFVSADLSDTLEEAYVGTNSGRIEALSFVAPVAYVQDLLILWSDKSRVATFGITVVLGVVLGSMAAALMSKSFRWEGFASTEDLANHLVGAALMGFGGVVAGGCTVGQGISGLSALSLTAMVATVGIVLGAWLSIKYQERRIEAMA